MTNAILIGGQKGGTGKTTDALNLGIMSQSMGHDTVIIDTDQKQFSSAKLIQRRQELGFTNTPACVQLVGKITREIENLAKRYERVIIDAGGRDSVEIRCAMTAKCVGMLISPFQPSDLDLATLEEMDDMVMGAQGYNQNLIAYILFSLCETTPKDKTLIDAKKFCNDFQNMKTCEVDLYRRVAYKHSASEAKSIVEYETDNLSTQPLYRYRTKPPKASLEICALYEFVFKEKFKNGFIEQFYGQSQKMNEAEAEA